MIALSYYTDCCGVTSYWWLIVYVVLWVMLAVLLLMAPSVWKRKSGAREKS